MDDAAHLGVWFSLVTGVALPVSSLFGDEGLRTVATVAAITAPVALTPLLHGLFVSLFFLLESDDE